MNSEDTFWTRFFTLVTIIIVCAVFSITSCTMYRNNKISESIKDGKNPIEVACALGAEMGTTCIILSSKK